MKVSVMYREGQRGVRILNAETGEAIEGITGATLEIGPKGPPTLYLAIEPAAVSVETDNASGTYTMADGTVLEGPLDDMSVNSALTGLNKLSRFRQELDKMMGK